MKKQTLVLLAISMAIILLSSSMLGIKILSLTKTKNITTSVTSTEYPLVSLSDAEVDGELLYVLTVGEGGVYRQMAVDLDSTEIVYTYIAPKAVKKCNYGEDGEVISEIWIFYVPDKTVKKGFEIDNN